ncbi:MAG: riboflavin synthase [Thermodesulfovibrio sp.]|jgi:riboflavin synthase|uniref:riboflavin synthase n=1 Tax=unclassified Thermodesulfovibrio TaxID=2645936 RepID=UPI000839F6CB|nr:MULTISPECIES: riboflavin synthase [unclassified Thermodesulfovibrio]MDI1472897.1 riboflavin synthase [Thermodesulfovibrio sp. 1176]MDI6714863.1 riboflavin synthase [Thermodesulfovibrio sp.]ODA44751.1 Riboflavin synthase eubacterial/eukaryotic [Thermodesulfovibrio sp. N1]
MFTGIIVELGKIAEIQKIAQGARLNVFSNKVINEANLGDSISINGVCLTVSEMDRNKNILSFDVSFETLKKTTLGELKKGDYVNLEPALTLNTKLGGHLVSGHVEDTGIIKKIENIGDYLKIEIEAKDEILRYCIPKGSIAIDGISLTIVDLYSSSFTVVIIPHTAKMTTIGFKKVGDKVNLETDIIAKYVEKFVNQATSIRQDRLITKLKDYGFIKE